jgi:hypothetical protein
VQDSPANPSQGIYAQRYASDGTPRRWPRSLGAQMVRDVASKTSDVAGDGTTTATILAQAIGPRTC